MTTDKKLTVDDLSPDQRKVYDVMFDWSENRWSDLLTCRGFARRKKLTAWRLLKSLQHNIGPVRTAVTVELQACCLESSRPHVRDDKSNVASGKALTGRFKNLFYSASSPSRHALLRHDPSAPLPARHRRQDRGAERLGQARRAGLEVQTHHRRRGLYGVRRPLRDLQFHGAPILAVGDHGQLPPVMASGDLMQKPMLRLEKIDC